MSGSTFPRACRFQPNLLPWTEIPAMQPTSTDSTLPYKREVSIWLAEARPLLCRRLDW